MTETLTTCKQKQKEHIEYFNKQLTIVAQDIQEARKLDKHLHLTETSKVKELIQLHKKHRFMISQSLASLLKNTKESDLVYQEYNENTESLINVINEKVIELKNKLQTFIENKKK